MLLFFASCPKGLESLLETESEAFGFEIERKTVAGVHLKGELKAAYRFCLWSRLANRLIMRLALGSVHTGDEAYALARTIAWHEIFSVSHTFAVDFIGTNKGIKNSQFGARTIKDAIVDSFREKFGERPSVDLKAPAIRVSARLSKNQLYLGLDLAGESLHRRGYRKEQGAAPLKENLAAALLLRADWPEMAAQGRPLLDPMCGSGTLLIEAGLFAANIAPGLMRREFGFTHWHGHDEVLWQNLVDEALDIKNNNLAQQLPEIRGYDIDARLIEIAEANIERAGLGKQVRVIAKPLSAFKKPTHKQLNEGLIICNPPYGERLGDIANLKPLYSELVEVSKRECPGWTLGVFSSNAELLQSMRLRSEKKYKFFNGDLPSELALYTLLSHAEKEIPERATGEESSDPRAELTPGAAMVFNRLRKNKNRLNNWLKSLDSDCFRLYDADIPEYAAAIDVYGKHIHVQEYAPPKSVAEDTAKKRFDEIVSAVCHYFECDIDQLSCKTRRKNKGKLQYEKIVNASDKDFFSVYEAKAKFRVNIKSYLDSGLFLDHRPLRLKLAEQALGKTFLNLFCYTASATVHVALGGAKKTVSVDMSKTYLSWARENFELNSLSLKNHRLVQENCIEWLASCREGFDLILLDPPSFSNSKRMEGVLDIQRDHISLIKRCMELLNPEGILYFSNNLRSFKLDEQITQKYAVANITKETIDKDFERSARIHQCFQIQHLPK